MIEYFIDAVFAKNNFVVSSFQVILPLFKFHFLYKFFFSHTIYIIPKIIPFSLLLFVLGYTANAASIIVIINNIKAVKLKMSSVL